MIVPIDLRLIVHTIPLGQIDVVVVPIVFHVAIFVLTLPFELALGIREVRLLIIQQHLIDESAPLDELARVFLDAVEAELSLLLIDLLLLLSVSFVFDDF